MQCVAADSEHDLIRKRNRRRHVRQGGDRRNERHMLVGAEASVFRRSECHGSLRQINVSALAGWNVAPQIPATRQQDEIHEPGRDHDSQPIAPATSESNAGALQ